MTQRILNPSIIARAAVKILENELVMANRVYRGYEDEFAKRVNGYTPGDTITINRPADFTVRDGATATAQDVAEGKTTFVVNKQKGVDFKFTSKELTLNIGDLAERVIRPAMIQLANQVDSDLALLYRDVWNWVGTPGLTIDTFADFAKAPERLDITAVPNDARAAVLSPTDTWAMAGSQTALFMQNVAGPAYRQGTIGMIGGVDTYMSQNVQTHSRGTAVTTTATISGTQSTDWATTQDSGTMSLGTKGWGTVQTLKAGDVFTIGGVFSVNPVTKATLSNLQQFVVKADATANVTTSSATTLTVAPPIITSGAFQTVSAAANDGATVTLLGTASTNYNQNLVFHKNAFGLVVVPMIRPPGAVDVARESYRGLSVRLIPYYDGTNDASNYRLDILYGVKTIDPRLATRINGT